jgi:PAS domain S-box-containing protein
VSPEEIPRLSDTEVRYFAAWVSAVAVVVGLFRRQLLKVTRASIAWVRSLFFTRADLARFVDARIAEIAADLRGLHNKVDHLVKETSPNGGSTIKDVMNRVSHDVRIIGAKSRAYKEGLDVPMGECDVNGQLIWSSSPFQLLLGVTEDEITGSSWQNYIADYDVDRVLRTWEKAVKDHSFYRSRHHMRSSTGREFPVEIVARPIFDPLTDHFEGWVWRLWERGQTGQQPSVGMMPPPGRTQ